MSSLSLRYDLSSLRVLGTVGEPINPEAWLWYHDVVGQQRCPVIDTFWQTETVKHIKLYIQHHRELSLDIFLLSVCFKESVIFNNEMNCVCCVVRVDMF